MSSQVNGRKVVILMLIWVVYKAKRQNVQNISRRLSFFSTINAPSAVPYSGDVMAQGEQSVFDYNFYNGTLLRITPVEKIISQQSILLLEAKNGN